MIVDPMMFRLVCAIQGLSLKQKTGLMLTRGATNKNLMAIVSEYTGKRYTRNSVNEAIKDGTEVLDNIKRQIQQQQQQQQQQQ